MYDVYQGTTDRSLRLATTPDARPPAHVKRKDWVLLPAGKFRLHSDVDRDVSARGYCFSPIYRNSGIWFYIHPHSHHIRTGRLFCFFAPGPGLLRKHQQCAHGKKRFVHRRASHRWCSKIVPSVAFDRNANSAFPNRPLGSKQVYRVAGPSKPPLLSLVHAHPTVGKVAPVGAECFHEIKYSMNRLRIEHDGDRVRLIPRDDYDSTKRDPARVVDEGSDEVAQAAGRRCGEP